MLKIEIEIINQHLNNKYELREVFLDNDELVEKLTGKRYKLADNVFCDILKAKRLEHLKRCCIGGN